jgi:hypothetical protein
MSLQQQSVSYVIGVECVETFALFASLRCQKSDISTRTLI